MNKKTIAFLCVLALLLSMIPGGAAFTAQAAEIGISYQVGYSKKDVTPYIQNAYAGDLGIPNVEYSDADTYVGTVQIHNPSNSAEIVEVPFVKVPMSGYGAVTTRLADKMTDDNGDGLIGLGDGIFVTATVVTDDWGNTVIYMTTDLINGQSTLTGAVRKAIAAALPGVKESQIMITGSHTHEGPTIANCYTSWNKNMNTENKNATGDVTAMGAYWLYFVDQMKAAAEEAYHNRSKATMTKGEMSSREAMAAMGYTYTDSKFDNYGEGFMLNSVRHYDVKKTVRSVIKSNWTGKVTSDTTTVTSWVGGDNFGSVPQPSVKEEKNSGILNTNTITTTIEVDHVSEVNDKMYILKFDRAEGNPIVLINWRAHASICGGSPYTNISSDYINALRYRLENNTMFGGSQNYCVAFWQGASGNVNNTSRLNHEYKYVPATPSTGVGYTTITLDDNKDGKDDVKVPWEKDATSGFYYDYYQSFTNASGTENYTDQVHRCALYGYLLGKVALYTMENGMTTGLDHGKIHAVQSNYAAPTRQYTAGEIAAATQWKADYDAGKVSSYPYNFNYNGTNVALNSYYHGYSIINRSSAASVAMELNAIIMGENVALVTGTGEQFDRYSASHTTGNTAANDWDKLVSSKTYGTPFMLSYSNNSTGYAPNTLAYDFYTDQNGKVPAGTAMGSYEANTTSLAKGVGEAVIDKYVFMLKLANSGTKTKYCEACKKTVDWEPLTAEHANTRVSTGHYYLYEDLVGTANSGDNSSQWGVGIKTTSGDTTTYTEETVCLDLAGHAKTSITRNFIIYKGSVLNIFDSVGGGYVQGQTYGNNPGGGNISVETGGTLNLYGGTLKFKKIDSDTWFGTGVGGVVSLTGTFNMYGGTVEGGEVVKSSYTFGNNGCGGAVYVYPNAKLNVYGGTITSGSVPETGRGPCVFLASNTSKILLSGDASVEDIYFEATDNSGNLTVSGKYTGTAGLTFKSTISDGRDIGAAENMDISGATFTCTNNSKATVTASGSNLLLSIPSSQTGAICYSSQGIKAYKTLAAAANEYSDGIIKLVRNDTSAVTLKKDTIVDLSGFAVMGAVKAQNGTLYCLDSKTDDYTVADGNYGFVTNVTGNVAAVQNSAKWDGNDYMMIRETDGLSFHRVDLEIYAMTLRPEVNGVTEPGVYYKSSFVGDEVVAEYVDTFGVALNVKEMPNAENMDTTSKYSWFKDFESGENANDATATGTLLKGIMKARNSEDQNARYAAISIYGRPYIKDVHGNYVFGPGVSRSLQEEIELIDAQWDGLGESQNAVAALYKKFASVMKNWDVPNMRAAYMNADLVFTSENRAFCTVCEKEVEWTAITQEGLGTTGVGSLNGTELHYYLAEDITYEGADDFITGPSGGRTVCIHLNGHNFTGTQARFLFGYASQSRVLGNGIVTSGKNVKTLGGVAWNTSTKTNVNIHLYGGTYTVTANNTQGSPVAIQDNGGELHIHEGVKVIGSATAPAIYVGTSSLRTSDLYIDGATIEGTIKVADRKTAAGFSTTVVLEDTTVSAVELGKDTSFTVAGSTVIGNLKIASGAKFTVGDLEEGAMITIAGDGVVSEAKENMERYYDYFKPFEGQLSITNNALVMAK